jgi:hypothetical protein
MGDWMALYRYRAARRSGAQIGFDPTAQKLKVDQIHGSKRGCPTGCRTEGPNGVVPTADRMNACQIYGSNHGARRGAGRGAGVKPPKRRIELGWVTRGTRLKKPYSSRGFARKARGARGTRGSRGSRGSWGLKTEIVPPPLFQPTTLYFFSRPDGGRMGLDGVPDWARWSA